MSYDIRDGLFRTEYEWAVAGFCAFFYYAISRDELHEKNSRIHLDRLQNKCANNKGVKNNINFGQITGIQEKLDTTCKLNASK